MKKLRTKQAVICFIGVAVCKLGFAGCYPFIPAYFAAATWNGVDGCCWELECFLEWHLCCR
ncbi:hypothetical protein [Roseburia sp. AF42-8]|uniref:hypothetical protein n=1 Tax=Roseburia sp. AF42-8 TaxID=2293137 RepID=UPI0011C17E76|nr:hypothetical protein [Roseburia sp. AF42-8]